MNLNAPIKSDLVRLLHNNDDSVLRRLVVRHNGEVEIVNASVESPTTTEEQSKFYYETWAIGNDYSGPKAAADDEYVEKLYDSLLNKWNNNAKSFQDFL